MAPNGNPRLPRQDSNNKSAPLSRSNSAHSTTAPLRPKSRGSTTSLQSVGVGNAFQPAQPEQDQNMPIDQSAFFMHNAPNQGPHPLYPQHDEAMMPYAQHMPQLQQAQMMDHPAGMHPHPDIRPMSQHGFHEMQQFSMQYPNGMPQYQLPPQHMHHIRHQSEQYEGSPAPEDSNNENGGSKRRKGTASSVANDQELRRLLAQYKGKTLKEIALEVQKNEGSGGKSEKAKQVFAMLWLQESCQRSNNSVRRDRVFARYTERCGNERVPTLNPASFGKLVRIIFPNVQTRRLGVRGESKYHYVDLSLVPDENDRHYDFDRPGTAGDLAPERPGSSASFSGSFALHTKAASLSHLPSRVSMETADFPAPSLPYLSKTTEGPAQEPSIRKVKKLDCQYANTPTIRIPAYNMSMSLVNALPSVRSNMPATLSTYLAMPSETSLSQPVPTSQESPIELPDIHEYLKDTSYDPQLAKLLHDLYRSYCIDVIDAFRKCKDKSFFNHHSAFNGKMTVPVSKLFSLECVAPWIQECDMRMYRQILRYMTPLVVQNVPEPVWVSFDRISSRLVGHLIASFEEKCPSHVVVAKVVPAARFTNLLKKLRLAQAATLQISRILENAQQRTQMWLDVCAMVDPDTVIDESVPPPESISYVKGVLKHDLHTLLAPVADALVEAAEQDPSSAFAEFYREPFSATGILSNVFDSPADQLGKTIQWLQLLPSAFEGHHPQCMLDWQTRFFRSIMNQVGAGGAPSYQAWWYLEAFATHMLSFMTQLEGLLLPLEEQKRLDDREVEKRRQHLDSKSDADADSVFNKKRKRDGVDIGGEERAASPRPRTSAGDTDPESTVSASFPALTGKDDNHDETDEANEEAPLDLTTFRTGFTSPIKPRDDGQAHNAGLHDDSGIDLGLGTDLDHDALEAEKEAKKFNKRDWFLSSDPVEPHNVAPVVS